MLIGRQFVGVVAWSVRFKLGRLADQPINIYKMDFV